MSVIAQLDPRTIARQGRGKGRLRYPKGRTPLKTGVSVEGSHTEREWMEELELGGGHGGSMEPIARVIKEGSEEEYSSQRYTRSSGWSETRYVGSLLGKSVKAAQVAYVHGGRGLGDPVLELEE